MTSCRIDRIVISPYRNNLRAGKKARLGGAETQASGASDDDDDSIRQCSRHGDNVPRGCEKVVREQNVKT